MDANDLKALLRLQDSGRESWAALGQLLGMTGPAAAERVRRLEESGVIRGYTALIDPAAVGVTLTAFVAASLDRPKDRAAFLGRVRELPEVVECHHVAGDHDFLLKVRCKDTADLDRILSDEFKAFEGAVRTRTTIALRTLKETAALPIHDPERPSAARGAGVRKRRKPE